VLSQPLSTKRPPTIKFDSRDVVHSYKRPGTGDDTATHEHRQTRGLTLHDNYPPLSSLWGNDKEQPNLFSTSPTKSRQSTFPELIPKIPSPHESQMLHIPPSIANEHTIQSAPAAIRQTQSDPMPTTTSKGSLLLDSTSANETLLSFPSVTDSAPSEWGAVNADDNKDGKVVKKGRKSKEPVTAPKIPLKSPKRYPRGIPDDDDEESERLFRTGTISSEGHYDSNASSSPPDDVTGIRLVKINERDYF